jgi:hypothetical protein
VEYQVDRRLKDKEAGFNRERGRKVVFFLNTHNNLTSNVGTVSMSTNSLTLQIPIACPTIQF